jgi:hypothetical protein
VLLAVQREEGLFHGRPGGELARLQAGDGA